MNESLENRWIQHGRIFIALTLILPLFQGVKYALIGWFYPLLIITIITFPIMYYYFIRKVQSSKVLKYWGWMNLAYGVIGIGLFGLSELAGGGVPSSIHYQFTVWYVLKIAAVIVCGSLLLKVRKISILI